MKLELSKKNVNRLLIALVILIVVGFVVYRMYAKSSYVYPGASVTDYTNQSLYTILDTNIKQCQAAKANGGQQADYDTCVSSNVSFFTSNSCPAVISGITSANCGIVPGAYGAARDCNLTGWPAASTQLDTDLTAINTAYNDLYLYAGQTVSSGGATSVVPNSTIIDQAKRADVRAATRKYLAATCGSNKFYWSNTVTASGTAPTLFLGSYTAGGTSLTPATPLQTTLPAAGTAVSYNNAGTYTSIGNMGAVTPPASSATSPLSLRFGNGGTFPYTYGMGYFTAQTLTLLTPTPTLTAVSGTITPGAGTLTNGVVSAMTAAQGSSTAPVVFSISGSDTYTKLDANGLFSAWTAVASTAAAPAASPFGAGTVNYYFQDTNISGGNAYAGVQRIIKWWEKAANFASGSEVEYSTLTPLLSTSAIYNTTNSDGIPNWVIAQNFGPFTVLKKDAGSTGTPQKLPMTWYDLGTATSKTIGYTISTDPYV